ncbi:hypothetical protein BGZ80_003592 [Entomortierella chlamydospora]|uniref:Uncharacterized protein n=1 Tax=Entomortierella chlamydospora TaxID=101097 RepID=A0A9P6N238_9FUNG|nr:hypothetical protein BGZ80_003592 [Entomortierella chlamydospora]
MKPTFATAAAMEAPYDQHYPAPYSSLRESSPEREYSQHPRQHSSPSSSSSVSYPSSSSSSSSSSYTHRHISDEQQYHQQRQQQSNDYRQYQQESHSHHHSRQSSELSQSKSHASYVSSTHRAYEQYAQSYSNPTYNVKHTEGYEGRVRNTNRDHNDHLVTDSSARDQQHHHDQFRRDPTYGYLKQQPSTASFSPMEDDLPAYKYQLPPIHVPEQPFYRSDLPGRHMRYFSKVTSQDRENSDGYFSSARHVAPSNTTGNFGHGPPINQTLERFESARQRQLEKQRQQAQQEQGHRLPSLYTALPEQRPNTNSSMVSQQHESRQSHPQHQGLQPRARSPLRSPTELPSGSNGHHYQGYSQQQSNKIKPLQPRSIAPAPISGTGPLSPVHQKSMTSPTTPLSQKQALSTYASERQSVVKAEPRETTLPHQHYRPQRPLEHHQHQHQSSESQSEGKRKWVRDHSPVRMGSGPKACVDPAEQQQLSEATSQELHLLSRRPTLSGHGQVQLSKGSSQNQPRTRMQRYQMTTIRCWHGAIAQKSYGIEKRYLCPPPMVHVSAGVNAKQIQSEQSHVTMSILHEKLSNGRHDPAGSENLMEQDCSLDDNLKCSFRNLHVTGTGSDSSKRFKLGLQVFLGKNSTTPTALMDSNPIPIISKPSKKTAKAGNASCFILNGMSVSLLNRINAQTVRTKYMAVDNNAVCAKIGSWSSFTIKMVKPPPAPPVKIAPTGNMGIFRAANHSTKFVPIRMKGDSNQPLTTITHASENLNGPSQMPPMQQYQNHQASYHSQQQRHVPRQQQSSHGHAGLQPTQQVQPEPTYVFSNSEPVLYGSEIILINDLTGVTTDRLIIRKVENGKVIRNGSGPVSQMQKIVLQHPDRVHPEDGRPYYLSASSIGSPKIEGKIPLQAAMDRSPLLEYRTSSKKASILDLTETIEEDEDEYYGDETGNLGKRRMPKSQENVAVDDFVCWTIAGIAKFEYTYFAPIPASIDTDVNPKKVPKVLSRPRYNSQSNMMVMKVKNVFEKLSPAEEEARLRSVYLDDPYERRQTLSEFVYRRCEDVRQPIQDEEGPVQLWLAQHGAIRMRRRLLKDVLPDEAEVDDEQDQDDNEDSEPETVMTNEQTNRKPGQVQTEDKLPKIPTKPSAAAYGRFQQQQQQKQQQPEAKTKRVKVLSRAMGLEAELPHGSEVRTTHDANGNSYIELDILMVERASGIAYPTGYKVAYSHNKESSEWTVEVIA